MHPTNAKKRLGGPVLVLVAGMVLLIGLLLIVRSSNAGNSASPLPEAATNPAAAKLRLSEAGAEVSVFSMLSQATDADLASLSKQEEFTLWSLGEGGLAAIGRSVLPGNLHVTAYANSQKVCFGAAPNGKVDRAVGSCGDLSDAATGTMSVAAPSSDSNWRIVGLVPDGVQRVAVSGSDVQSRVTGNAYEIELEPKGTITLTGLSDTGREVFETKVPLGAYARG